MTAAGQRFVTGSRAVAHLNEALNEHGGGQLHASTGATLIGGAQEPRPPAHDRDRYVAVVSWTQANRAVCEDFTTDAVAFAPAPTTMAAASAESARASAVP